MPEVAIARLEEQLKAIHETLDRVDRNVERQNGRVRDLESWQSKIMGGLLLLSALLATVGAVLVKHVF